MPRTTINSNSRGDRQLHRRNTVLAGASQVLAGQAAIGGGTTLQSSTVTTQ